MVTKAQTSKRSSKKTQQLQLLKNQNSAFGGALFTTRKGRKGSRPLAVRDSMHLVLRSSKAMGEWSFKKKNNEAIVTHLTRKFSKKYGIKIHSLANVGNHLHFHLKLSIRHTYKAFIRALTASLRMAITKVSRWNKSKIKKFWDYRPYTRIVKSFQRFLNLSHYIYINQLEGMGCTRGEAKLILVRQESG